MAWRNFIKHLTVLVVICGGVLLWSCQRLATPKPQVSARNLTPGLTEDLTALARKHGGHTLLIADSSDGSEEAKNLEELMAKAFEAGNWRVIRGRINRRLIHGLHCSYPNGMEEVANDLSTVLKQKGLPIQCERKDIDPIFLKTSSSVFALEVGLKS